MFGGKCALTLAAELNGIFSAPYIGKYAPEHELRSIGVAIMTTPDTPGWGMLEYAETPHVRQRVIELLENYNWENLARPKFTRYAELNWAEVNSNRDFRPQAFEVFVPDKGATVNEVCVGCGNKPKWGSGRGVHWLSCKCWTTKVGTPKDVLTDWYASESSRLTVAQYKGLCTAGKGITKKQAEDRIPEDLKLTYAVWADIPFDKKCSLVSQAKIDSIWINLKSGRPVTVVGTSYGSIKIKHQNDSVTTKQQHYFASDYYPISLQ